MSENYLIGMDLGTTNVKAILWREDGVTVASASAANELFVDGVAAEQDADAWWENAKTVFRSLADQAGPEIMGRVRGLAISSQSVTLLPLDRDGRPLRRAIIWMDHRAEREMQEILDTVGRERYTAIVQAQPDSAFLAAKLKWFIRHEPALFQKTDCLLQASAYINFHLTGVRATDLDQALRGQCLDAATCTWSKEIAAAIGADLDALLPNLCPVDTVIGHVTAAAAAETGLPEGLPVTAGACDALASVYACGLSALGQACESSGTSSLVFAGGTAPAAQLLPVMPKPCSLPGVPYLFDAPITASGSAIRWYLDNLGAADEAAAKEAGCDVYTYLNQLALEAAPGSGSLLFFPYLMGERAPLWNAHARGMFIGLTLNTRRADMVRAIFEGTAFALRHVVEVIRAGGGTVDSLRITGGGAKSRTWAAIKAAVLNVPVLLLEEGAGDVPFGDVLIAGQAVGLFPDLSETMDRFVRVKEVIEPDPAWAAVYDRLFPFYRDIYPRLDETLLAMSQLEA